MTIDNSSTFPKKWHRDQNTNQRLPYQSCFTAGPEIAGRPIGKEKNRTGKNNGKTEHCMLILGFVLENAWVCQSCFTS